MDEPLSADCVPMGDVRGYNSQTMPAATVTTRAPLGAFRSKRLLSLAGDERLVEQVRLGNELAFEIVFERYGAGILGFCRHMLGSVEEAEDAVQHTFAAAYRDLQRNGERAIALKAWLYTIARNRCVSMLRARREEAEELRDIPTEGLGEQVQRRAELRELLADVRELPEDQRAALLLAEAAGLSHAEVGQVLGCEAAAVKGIVFRARSGLIERRAARETPCDEIRAQLATLRGGALRRNELRHHLRHCPGCSAFREQVRHQRKLLAAALPVMPTAGLKSSVLAAVGIGGAAAGGGGLGAAAGGAAGGVLGGTASGGAVGGALGGALGGAVGGALGGGASAGGFALGSATVTKLALVGVLAGGGIVAGEAVMDHTEPARPGQVGPAAAPESHGAGGQRNGVVTGGGRTGNARDAGETGGARGQRISSERSHGQRGAERSHRHGAGGKQAKPGRAKSHGGRGLGRTKGGAESTPPGQTRAPGARRATPGARRAMPEPGAGRASPDPGATRATPDAVAGPGTPTPRASPRAVGAPTQDPAAQLRLPPGQAKKN
jgi:RNA polymerase sigma factor (sigma-70 family)